MRRVLVLLLALTAAAPRAAVAEDEIRISSELPIALAEPRDGTVLDGGSRSRLAWRPLDGFGAIGELADVDEWEAFLSVDGGRTYPLRITPELDLDRREIAWEVPNLASDDVRLLFHFGGPATDGERIEVAMVLPQTFRIALADDAPVSPGPSWMLGRGQLSLPDEPGVAGWVEGTRRGERLRSVRAWDAPASFKGYQAIELDEQMAQVETDPPPSPNPLAAPSGERLPTATARARTDSRPRAPLANREILLQSSRLNE